jgi:hypothetical protein
MQNITQNNSAAINKDIEHYRASFLGYYKKHRSHENAKALQAVIEHALILSTAFLLLTLAYGSMIVLKAIF